MGKKGPQKGTSRPKVQGLASHADSTTVPLCAGKVSPYAATGSPMFFMLKAFGAGVILATGFIHMWPDANEAFSNSCLGGCPLHIYPISLQGSEQSGSRHALPCRFFRLLR